MKAKNNRLLLVCIIGFCVGIFIAFLFGPSAVSMSMSNETVRIVLTEDGFVPTAVRVKPGTVVEFTTTRNGPFWPASDPHPVHDRYPQFDPRRAILPGDSWSITLTQPGTWDYHDHLAPSFIGQIEVVSGGIPLFTDFYSSTRSLVQRIADRIGHTAITCDATRLSRGDLQKCWEEVVTLKVQSDGVEKALLYLEELRKDDVSFASDCHVYAHRIGEEGYRQYAKGKRFQVTPASTLCNLGFYHGFMQEYTSHGNNLAQAGEFCEWVKSELLSTPGVRVATLVSQCYHGIGHGLAFTYAPALWDDENAIIDTGLEACKKVGGDFRECVNGVFGGITAMYFGLHGFKLEMDVEDPFHICKNREEFYQILCYDSLVPPAYQFLGSDFVKLGHIIENIASHKVAMVAMEHLGFLPSHAIVPRTNDYSEVVRDCRSFSRVFHLACLKGFSRSLIDIGEFTDALQRTLGFCRLGSFSKEETATCFAGAIDQTGYSYGTDKLALLCPEIIEMPYHTQCEIERAKLKGEIIR